MGAKQAVGIVKRRDIAAAEDPEAARDAYANEYSDEHLTADVAAAEGFVDEHRRSRRHAPPPARGAAVARGDPRSRRRQEHPALMQGLVDGKKLLITGVITRDSIAFEVARQAIEQGADVVLTGFGRAKRLTDRAAKQLPGDPVEVLELDVNKPEDLEAVAADLADRWGRVDGVLHAIAFAPGDALGGNFLSTPPESAITAFQTSAFSFKALAVALADLYPERGREHRRAWTSTPRSPGRSTTGWASRRPRWRRPRATSRATSARAACA